MSAIKCMVRSPAVELRPLIIALNTNLPLTESCSLQTQVHRFLGGISPNNIIIIYL